MKQNPLCIAFASQKGGVGKSTLTVLAASWLHYLHGIRVAVVDCDCPSYGDKQGIWHDPESGLVACGVSK